MLQKNRTLLILITCFLITNSSQAQSENTVGLLQYNGSKSYPGYNLIYPNNQSSVFLLNQCGQLINEWPDENFTAPGAVAKLTAEGNLLKAKSSGEFTSPSFGAGGSGGIIELYDWDSHLLARRVIRDSIFRQHHDLAILPNGNIMCLVYERKFLEDIVEAGFDTIANNQTELWFDCVFELSPDLDSIVWEWHSWDHVVQDFDETKNNFGDVKENAHRFDLNYQEFAFGRSDFMHSNSIDYNEELDQIIISVRNYQEIWIIDHSTTVDEAATSSGGNSGIGGDILFRWGNPIAHKNGEVEDQTLIYQHDAKWISNESSEYDGQLLVFNNKIGADISVGEILRTTFDTLGQKYLKQPDGNYFPEESTRQVSHPDSLKNDSTHASNIQLLENGNFLICAASQGRIFELTDDEEPVWEYVVPLVFGEPVPQGTIITASQNFNNQVQRYPLDFSGFIGKDLSPQEYLELEPNEEFCLLNSIKDAEQQITSLEINNPVFERLLVKSEQTTLISIFDQQGRKILNQEVIVGYNEIDVSIMNQGIYYIIDHLGGNASKMIKL